MAVSALRLEPLAGSHIMCVAQNAKRLARTLGVGVCFNLNGAELIVFRNSDVCEVAEEYERKLSQIPKFPTLAQMARRSDMAEAQVRAGFVLCKDDCFDNRSTTESWIRLSSIVHIHQWSDDNLTQIRYWNGECMQDGFVVGATPEDILDAMEAG